MSETSVIKKDEFSRLIAEKCGSNIKDAKIFIDAFVSVVKDQLMKDNKIQLVGFGTFEVVERAAREARNPMTGEAITVGPSKSPKFRAGKALKDIVNI